MDDFGLPTPPAPTPVPAPQPIPETPVIAPPKKKFPVKVVAGALMALLLIGGGWFGFQEMQTRQTVEKMAGACAAKPCGPGYQCDGSGGCVPRGTTDEDIKSGKVKPIDPPEEPWRDPDGDGVSKPNDNGGCPADTYQCGGSGASFNFCLSKGAGKTCNESALEQGYTVRSGNCSTISGSPTVWYCEGKNAEIGPGCQGTDPLPGSAGWDGNNKTIKGNFCGVIQVDGGNSGSCSAKDISLCDKEPATSETSPSPSPNPNVSCIGLTSNKTAPTMGDTVNFTCKADFSAAAPVAIFRHNISGGSYIESAQLPLNSSGEAGYSLTVNQTGNWSVQCRVCTDSTATTCTAWGQAQ